MTATPPRALAQTPPAAAAPPAAPIAAAAAPISAPALPPAAAAYRDALLGQARAERLWEERLWHVLMHYADNLLLPGVTSEVDNAAFFLSPQGRTDPQAELEATLVGAFSSAALPGIGLSAQCAFPARHAFLRERLAIDPARLPAEPCPRFEVWRDALDPGSVSLVFASYFYNNPASMFGHTFLVMEKRGRGPQEQMLNYTINFGAQVPSDFTAIGYAFNGLFGGYEGLYHLLPYYAKIKEYNDIDKRDLWEYRFHFRPEQLERMVRHAWELNWARHDYFFLDENCSYQLLTLLEAADPELHLREDVWLYALPSDTVLTALRHISAVDPVRYRPSRRSLLLQKLAAMTDAERDLTQRIMEHEAPSDGPQVAALAPGRQALVLDAVIDYRQLFVLARSEEQAGHREALRHLLIQRSRLKDAGPPPEFPPVTTPPNEGHQSASLVVAGGAVRPTAGTDSAPGFLELSLQPAFHELMSQDRGFPPFSQTTVLRLTARYEEPAGSLRLTHFNVVDILSISPYNRFNRSFSWRFDGGWGQARDEGCAACTPFYLHFGIGFAAESHVFGHEAVFALLHGRMEMHHAFETDYRAGPGLSVGWLADPSERVRLALLLTGTEYLAGQQSRVTQGELRARYALTPNLEAGLYLLAQRHFREAKLALVTHF